MPRSSTRSDSPASTRSPSRVSRSRSLPNAFGSPRGIPLQYQLRNVEPSSVPCIVIGIDLTAPNTVTLYGSN